MKRSSKALRMAQPLAVVAVWAGLLGYVIPAAFATAPTVSATAASSASGRDASPAAANAGSPGQKPPGPASSRHHLGPAKVRVMQAAPRPRQISVTVGHKILADHQAFASITPYRSVRPGVWTVLAAGAHERATTRVTLAAGSHTTLVVLGNRHHLVISVAGIAPEAKAAVAGGASGASRASKPSGPPAGAATKSRRSPVPWVVLGGTGLLLALAGLARLRQLRWARRVAAHIP